MHPITGLNISTIGNVSVSSYNPSTPSNPFLVTYPFSNLEPGDVVDISFDVSIQDRIVYTSTLTSVEITDDQSVFTSLQSSDSIVIGYDV